MISNLTFGSCVQITHITFLNQFLLIGCRHNHIRHNRGHFANKMNIRIQAVVSRFFISHKRLACLITAILALFICIYELSIIFRLIKAKNGEIIDAKYISVKRKYIFFETLEFEIEGNKIYTSPLLFIRGYEIIYRKDISKIGLIKYKNKYYVFYKN